MCGIAGYITKKNTRLNHKDLEKRGNIYNGLLTAMQERGTDSSGTAFVNKNYCRLVKSDKNASELILKRRYSNALNANTPIAIGHTRYATLGDTIKRNAHPFLRDSIIGVHNGQIKNLDDFKKLDYQVDSEIIFKLLAETKNDYKKVFKKLSGTFTVVYSDLSEKDYHLYITKHDNPIYFAYVKQLKTIFYASTELALRSIIVSHFKKFDITTIKEDQFIKIDSNLNIERSKVEFKPISYGVYSYPSYGGFYQDNDTCLECGLKSDSCNCYMETCDSCQNHANYYIDDDSILCKDCFDSYKDYISKNKLEYHKI